MTQTRPDPESTRNRIMDAALDVFARKGYHDTRLDEIVTESTTSKGAIYFHFPNKEQLFLALVDQFADLLERRVTAAIAQETGMIRVRLALETVIATFSKYRRPAKILLVQAVGLGAPFESKRNGVTDRFAQLIAGYLQEAGRRADPGCRLHPALHRGRQHLHRRRHRSRRAVARRRGAGPRLPPRLTRPAAPPGWRPPAATAALPEGGAMLS